MHNHIYPALLGLFVTINPIRLTSVRNKTFHHLWFYTKIIPCNYFSNVVHIRFTIVLTHKIKCQKQPPQVVKVKIKETVGLKLLFDTNSFNICTIHHNLYLKRPYWIKDWNHLQIITRNYNHSVILL